MIQFPQELHQIYQFERNGKKYAADLNLGCIIETDTIILHILSLCEKLDRVQLLEQLEADYGRSAVKGALRQLEAFAAAGMFFAGHKTQSPKVDKSERLHLFVSPGFLNVLTSRTFTGKLEYLYLLSALAKEAEVEIGVPIQNEDSLEAQVEFDVEGIKKAPFKADRRFSPTKSVPPSCHPPYSQSDISSLHHLFSLSGIL
jgi:hypothetical protein